VNQILKIKMRINNTYGKMDESIINSDTETGHRMMFIVMKKDCVTGQVE
jgi:hypothetical protein